MSEGFARQWSNLYRPMKLSDVIGNETAKKQVKDFFERKDAQVLLFHGPSGSGKTTIAWIVARRLTKGFPTDLEETNVAADGGKDKVREIIDAARFLPKGQYKVNVLEEVHALTAGAKAALLRPMEEPPHNKLLWIMTTDKPHLLDKPMLNRALKIQIKLPTVEQLTDHLLNIMDDQTAFNVIKKESKREELAIAVAKAANLVPREALQILQAASSELSETTDIKELIVNSVRKFQDGTDKQAMQIILALFSKDKSKDVEFRLSHIANQFGVNDCFPILNRLIYINHVLLMNSSGFRMPAMYYYEKELAPVKALPTTYQTMKAASVFADLRQQLSTVNIDPAHLIVHKIMQLCVELQDRRRNDD